MVSALAITGTARAQWTPAKPGDPRVCPAAQQATPVECAAAAAAFAFTTKYSRVTGHPFASTLHCSSTGTVLSYVCAWGSPAGTTETPVRFSHKKAGWKAAVGVIPAP